MEQTHATASISVDHYCRKQNEMKRDAEMNQKEYCC